MNADVPPEDSDRIESVRSGQKRLILGVTLFCLGLILSFFGTAMATFTGLSFLIGLVASIFGILRVSKGLHHSVGVQLGLGLLMILPLFGPIALPLILRNFQPLPPLMLEIAFWVLALLPLIAVLVLLFLNSRASAFLKAAGFEVGLLGTKGARG